MGVLERYFRCLCLVMIVLRISCFNSRQLENNSSISSLPQHFSHHKYRKAVNIQVLHYILPHWGTPTPGNYTCDRHIHCEWIVSESLTDLATNGNRFLSQHSPPLLSIAMYNIHTLWEKYRNLRPQLCQLETNITLYETEESVARFSWHFQTANQYFDGYSSTHPNADVQRVYSEAFLNNSLFFPLRPFASLIKAGSYLASDCHRSDGANSHRNEVVQQIRSAGFRVDGLGRCLRTRHIPEGLNLQRLHSAHYDLVAKREVINHYAFNMAFENSIEDGYVTEKPFDALLAGTVPVYLGDASHLKSLIPDPKSVIFLQDFANTSMLAQYLFYLLCNETAYEEHRAWRKTFQFESFIRSKPLLEKSWYCRVCEWGAKQYRLRSHRDNHSMQNVSSKISNRRCSDPITSSASNVVKHKLSSEKEGVLYRPSNQKGIYMVKDGTLHLIPDFQTFLSLGLDVSKIEVIDPHTFDGMIVGSDLPRSG